MSNILIRDKSANAEIEKYDQEASSKSSQTESSFHSKSTDDDQEIQTRCFVLGYN